MLYQFRRILCDKKKICMSIAMMLLPSMEIFQILYEHWRYGAELPYPMYAAFLSLYSRGHMLQLVYLWFLPMYLLVVVGEEAIEDFQTGYKNILICKKGKKSYIRSKLKGSFLSSFNIVAIGLLLNLILIQCVCFAGTNLRYGGQYKIFDPTLMPETLLFELSYTHPLLTNVIYILITALFAGLIGMIGTMLSIILHDRKLVYSITFALWFIPILFKNSFMLVFQPFSEYGFNVIIPLILWTAGLYFILMIIMMMWEENLSEI